MSSLPTNKMLAKAIVIFGGTQVFTILASIIRSKIAALTIGTAGVGLMALYTSITQFLAQLTNLGIQDSSVQVLSAIMNEKDNAQKLRDKIALIRLWEVVTSTASLFLMLVLTPLLALIYFGSVDSHLHSLILLSLTPAAIIVTSFEMSIMKSLQQTKRITSAVTLSAVFSTLISVPFFYFMGWNGIPFAVVGTSVSTALITLYYSYQSTKVMPVLSRLKDFKMLWLDSRDMIIMGSAFIASGIASMGSDLLLQTYFNTISTIGIVGLYKMSYMLSIHYPGLIFTAVNYDYFPRLSSFRDDPKQRDELVRKQIKVLLLIVTPCIVAFIVLMPWIVPLLLSDEFMDVVPVARIGCLVTIVRCVSLPVCFLPMAMGKPKDFLQVELVSYAAMIVCVILGLKCFGLIGVGVGFVVAWTTEFIYCYFLCRRKYNFRLMRSE